MTYSLKIQMRYTDFDPQINVNHMYYDSYIELTYLTFLREEVNPAWHFGNVRVQLYEKKNDKHPLPILPDSVPVVELSLLDIGHAHFTFLTRIYDERTPERIYFEGERKLVHVKWPERKAGRLPAECVGKIKQFFHHNN